MPTRAQETASSTKRRCRPKGRQQNTPPNHRIHSNVPRTHADRAQSPSGGRTHSHHKFRAHNPHQKNPHTTHTTGAATNAKKVHRKTKGKQTSAEKQPRARDGEDRRPQRCHPRTTRSAADGPTNGSLHSQQENTYVSKENDNTVS
jgi:hypothetical protein